MNWLGLEGRIIPLKFPQCLISPFTLPLSLSDVTQVYGGRGQEACPTCERPWDGTGWWRYLLLTGNGKLMLSETRNRLSTNAPGNYRIAKAMENGKDKYKFWIKSSSVSRELWKDLKRHGYYNPINSCFSEWQEKRQNKMPQIQTLKLYSIIFNTKTWPPPQNLFLLY